MTLPQPPLEKRDARPFVAHHLRTAGDSRGIDDGAGLQLLARWIEELPARDARMQRIEASGALDYCDGTLHAGAIADRLLEGISVDRAANQSERDMWLTRFAEAVERHNER